MMGFMFVWPLLLLALLGFVVVAGVMMVAGPNGLQRLLGGFRPEAGGPLLGPGDDTSDRVEDNPGWPAYKRECPGCGAPFEPGWRLCPHCGQPLV